MAMSLIDGLSFRDFVESREKQRAAGGGHAYAYVSDRRTRTAFERAKAVELAVAAGVRMWKQVGKADLLGRAVKVGPRQFPRVYELGKQCADTLGVAIPTLYVVNSPHLNAATYGTNEDAFVLLNSALVDHLNDAELLSVVGHEVGHIHNNHVVYLTAMHYLSHVAGAVLRAVSLPATLGLRAWSRRAEVTCDRAGLLCSKDVDASLRALTKLALGSQKLYEQLDLEAFLEQHEEGKESVGRFGELFSTHPFLPKRVLCLRIFSQSKLFRSHAGLGEDGLEMEGVDERVHEYIKVVG